MADALLATAAEHHREVLDEKLLFETWGETPKRRGGTPVSGLPTRAPPDFEDRPRHQQWLVDTLWGREAVGIIGGEPKCGKSFLALDLAVAVAAGVPCLRHFPAAQLGPVLMYAAEDAGHIVRSRLEGIDVPVLRLDHRADRQRLLDTVQRIRPRLLVLDPLVRLHGVDENAVAEIAPILAFQ